MEICWLCGEEIEFRYIDGKCTPIHLSGGWCQGSQRFSGHSEDHYSPSIGYRYDSPSINKYCFEDICHPTKCPRCGEDVFFIRHNGGSVWVDSLGWPWPKHSCFENDAMPSWVQYFMKQSQLEESVNLLFGFIIKAKWLPRNRQQPCRIIVAIESHAGKRQFLATNGTNTADYLLGRAAMVDLENRRLITSNHEVRPILPIAVRPEEFDLPHQ